MICSPAHDFPMLIIQCWIPHEDHLQGRILARDMLVLAQNHLQIELPTAIQFP